MRVFGSKPYTATLFFWEYPPLTVGTTPQYLNLLVNVFLRAGANDFSKLQVRERYAPFPKRFLKRIVNVLQ